MKYIFYLSLFLLTVAVNANPANPPGPYYINLGDYAKGDGSDETEAIQKAIDTLPPLNPDSLRDQLPTFPGAVLYIPRPQKFYGISRTINIIEKWNITIECETNHQTNRNESVSNQGSYFRWLGKDNNIMFNIDGCMGLTINGLSLDGRDSEGLRKYKINESGKKILPAYILDLKAHAALRSSLRSILSEFRILQPVLF